MPGHLNEEQRKVLRKVALTYRRARRAGKGQSEAVDATIAEFGGHVRLRTRSGL
jgi:hypothetical protein